MGKDPRDDRFLEQGEDVDDAVTILEEEEPEDE